MAVKCTLVLAVVMMAVAYSSAGVVGGLGLGGVYGGGLGLAAYPRYGYQYGVSDGITGDNKQASEVRDGLNTATQYSQNLVHAVGAVGVPAVAGVGYGVGGYGLGAGLGYAGLGGIGGYGLGGIGGYGLGAGLGYGAGYLG